MEDVSKAVIEAVDHHAQIINISLSDITDLPQMRRVVDYAESHRRLIISSAGNRLTSASTKDGRRFPAAYSQVVGVTAVDIDLNITDDSVHGTQVDIAAPGAYVASTVPGGVDCLYATDAASTSSNIKKWLPSSTSPSKHWKHTWRRPSANCGKHLPTIASEKQHSGMKQKFHA